ncbi:MAG: twin-arginine translocase TatA/TatE family subunit [Rhodospirillales bacterium]|nr:twin-arginine translocase TatA/TatE family subunit [Rhodospirillales bacterium]
MGELSIWHWLVVLIVVMLLFGSGKLSTLMGDFAKGIKTFRNVMQEDAGAKPRPSQPVQPPAALSAEASPPSGAEADKTPVHHEG